ncbi:hypothetical protein [uncultured Fusobacterium sp.]|jgi:hypothetical protein|uniref:hypothetical protein n=1 Tax=uncultured Fusobacterium sp. TaxID=159267 RepID=UPI0025F95880|nr:hypothetical protein [uncultured Fusobacterium sp.]
MKKILLLTGIMALSATIFGAAGKDPAEAQVDVKAKIVKPLTISATAVDFGYMAVSETKHEETHGEVTITGTEGELIRLEVKPSEEVGYVKYTGPMQTFDVTLTTGSGTADNEKLKTTLSMFTQGVAGDDVTAGTYILEAGGKKEFVVGGTATASATQKEGAYTGKIYVKAMYN